MWKKAGLDPKIVITPSITTELRAQLPGARIGSLPRSGFTGARLYYHSKTIASPENRWAGANRNGYDNPAVDAILDRLVTTIEPPERLGLHRQLLQTQMADVPFIPLHVAVGATICHEAVSGIVSPLPARNWHFNIHEWDKR